MYAPDNEPRRCPDGSFDFAFYRRRAARERAQLWRDFLKSRALPLARVVIALAVIAIALRLIPAADGTGWNGRQAAGLLAKASSGPTSIGKF